MIYHHRDHLKFILYIIYTQVEGVLESSLDTDDREEGNTQCEYH